MKNLNKLGQKGFTLIEVLMAVLIIVILAVVGITQFNNFAADAKNAATKSNLAILRNAIGTMNALERVRCAKTTNVFPDVVTLTNNDITGCTSGAGTSGTGTATASCNPTVLISPTSGATYGANCAVAYAAGAYLNLIPLVDHPYVQGGIPNNPWTASISTDAPNKVTQDTAPAATAVACLNAAVTTFGAIAKAKKCATPSTAFGAPAATGESGWCYCQETGQIWANSANNDGLAAGSGLESTF